MPTPLELAGQAGGPRGGAGLTLYDPRLQQRVQQRGGQQRPAPTRRTNAPAPKKSPREYLRMAQEEGLAAQQEQKPDEGFGRGLGFLINNPITRTVMKPFEVLDYGRRAVTLGMEEFAEGITGDELNGTVGDDRSNWDKLNDPTYGVGQLLGDLTGNKWADRAIGLVGDIAFDPLTYLTAGVGGVMGKSGRAAQAATARATGLRLAEEAVQQGATEVAQAAIRRKWDDAAREIGRYGPGVIKDPEVLNRLGLQQQGLRFGRPMHPGEGFRIGGNTRVGDALGEVARKTNRATAGVRAGFYDTGLGSRMAAWRTPQLINKAHRIIRSGSDQAEGMKLPVALALVTFHDGDRLGSKAFRGEIEPAFTQLAKAAKGEKSVAATHLAEKAGTHTDWNMYADELLKKAERLGVMIPHRKNYVPHIVTPEAMDFLRGDEELRHAIGVQVIDLDDPSGVSLQRELTGGQMKIKGKDVDLGDGTIEDINKAMSEHFGITKFFEDDITAIHSKYINRLSSDVGYVQGLERLSSMFPDLMKMSDDPKEMLDVFYEMVDEAATKTANQELVSKLQARLSKVTAEVGEFEGAAVKSIEEGRSIVAGEAGAHLSRIRTMRTETRQRLSKLKAQEKSAVKYRDKVVKELDGEVEDMTARIDVLRREINQLTAQETAAHNAIAEAGESVDVRARAQQRATLISQKKRQLQTQVVELEADQELLDYLVNRLRVTEVKAELLGRLESTAPTPRPLPGVGRESVPQGESYVQLAGGPGHPADRAIQITPEEQRLNEMMESGEFYELTPIERNIISGAAHNARMAQLNNAEFEGTRRPVPRAVTRGNADEEYIERIFEQRRNEMIDEWAPTAQNPADVIVGSPGRQARQLSAQETAKRTNAVRLEAKAKQDIDDFLSSEAGEQWLDDIEALDGAGDIIRNPKYRYELPEFEALPPKGRARIELDALKEELAFAKSEKSRLTQLRSRGQSGKAPNPGAVDVIKAEIKQRQAAIAESERAMGEVPTRPGRMGADQSGGFGETTRTATEGARKKVARKDVPATPMDRAMQKYEKVQARIAKLQADLENIENPLNPNEFAGAKEREAFEAAQRRKAEGIKIDIKAAQKEADSIYPQGKVANLDAKVGPSQSGEARVAYEQERIARWTEEIADFEARLAELETGKQLNKGAARARLTSQINAVEQDIGELTAKVAKAEANVRKLERRSQAQTTRFRELQARVAKHRKAAGTQVAPVRGTDQELAKLTRQLEEDKVQLALAPKGSKFQDARTPDEVARLKLIRRMNETAKRIKQITEQQANEAQRAADTQRHLDIYKRLAALDESENEALRRATMRQRDEGYQLDITMRTTPRPDAQGRLRLPRTAGQIREDIDALETAGSRRLPSDPAQRSLITDKSTVIRYDTGTKDMKSMADRVLMATEIAVPYRSLLLHSGAITDEMAMAHSRQVWELRFAIDNVKEVGDPISVQNMIIASDRLRRSNEFLAKYGKAIDGGVEPSDAAAERIARQIVDNDVDRLEREIANVKADPEAAIDHEADIITEGLLNAIYEVSAADSYKQRINTMFRQEHLTPAQETAFIEIQERSTQDMIAWSKANLKKNRSKRTKAINRGDDRGVANADRAIKRNEKSLQEALTQSEKNQQRLVELGTGAQTKAMEGIQATLETLIDKPMTPQAAEKLGKVFSEDVVEQIGAFAEDQRFARIVNGEWGPDEVEEVEFVEFMKDLMNRAGSTFNPEISPLAQIEQAAKIQAAQEYDDARSLFSQVFDDLGMYRVGDMGKERTIGFNPARQTLNEKELKNAVAANLEKKRGMDSQRYVLRDLEFRRNRLDTISRGMGRKGRAGKEILNRVDETGRKSFPPGYDGYIRGTVPDGQKLPKLGGAIEEGMADADPEAALARASRGYRRETLREIREDRNANRGWAPREPHLSRVSWEEAVFGRGTTPRPVNPIARPKGEQAARQLSGTVNDLPRPSGAFTRNGNASKLTALQEELAPHQETERFLRGRLDDTQRTAEGLRGTTEMLKGKVKQGVQDVGETQRQIDAEVGSTLTPEIDDALKRVSDNYDPKIQERAKELEELETKRAAYEKGVDKHLKETVPKLQSLREDIRLVDEALHGPKPGPIEQPPIGGFRPEPQGATSSPSVVPDYPSGKPMSSLPAAGESSASKSLDKKFEEASEIAKRTTKNTVAVAHEMGGVKTVAEEFNQVMAEIGMPYAETMMVRTLLADAVGMEAGADLLRKGAEALQREIVKGNANQLKTVTESTILATWKPMAESLLGSADDATKAYMHAELAKYFTRINEVLPTNRFWKAIEAYTNFFKTYATLRPDFHIRNAMSAMFMNSSDGVPVHFNFKAMQAWKKFSANPQYLDQLRKSPKAMSDFGMTNAQLADAFEAALGSGAGGQFAERGVSDSHRRLLNNPVTRFSKKVGTYVEGPVRLAMAMDSIANQGMDKYGALTRITRIHFDYAEVSNFDQMAKRFIPFWTFMSRNLPLQITQMLTKPKWYAWANSFQRNFSTEGDPGAPDYWSKGGGFQLPEGNIMQDVLGTKDPVWLTPDLAHNRLQSDVESMFNTATMQDASFLSNLLPAFSVPLELAMKKDMFTGRTYQSDDVQQLGGLEKILTPLQGMMGGENGFVPEQMLQAGRSLIPTWDQAARLFPGVVTGNESQLDKERQAESWARRLGLPIRQLTPQVKENTARSRYYDEQEAMRRQVAMSGGA